MSDHNDAGPTGTRLFCEISVGLLPVDGAAVATRAGPHTSALLYATDPVIARLDDLEFVTGEGPCLAAYGDHSPVLEPDLGGAAAAARWPWFTREAADTGAGAVFAFPLQIGAMVFGVIWFYRRARGDLTGRDLSTALGLARPAAAVVLHDVAESSREELDAHAMDVAFGRMEIDQAIGVIAVQRHVDIEQARDLLRGAAFAQNKTSHAVAADVLAHRLLFTPDTD